MSRRSKRLLNAEAPATATAAVDELKRVVDAFQNQAARLGFGTPNLLEGTDYPLTRLTRNYQLMNALYRSHWIVQRVIDIIPGDMCKTWVSLTTQESPEALDRFKRTERKTRTRAKILEALKWGRLYGGAAGVMLIKGQEKSLDKPLDLDQIMPDGYKGLLILDRWSGIYPSGDLCADVDDPDFGLPNSYQITLENAQTLHVHHSRVLRFVNREMPHWERIAELYWGVSEIEVIFDELKKRDNTSWNIAQLIFQANLRILKMGNLGQTLALAPGAIQQNLMNTLQMQNWLASSMGVQILNKDDEYQSVEFTGFRGLADVYECFMMDLSGACRVPVTKLFGRSPAGMNATGESDLQNYYDMIEEEQESKLRPAMDKLFPVIAMSSWGRVPDDLDYRFNPCRTMPAEKVAELAGKKTEAIVSGYNAIGFSQQTAMKELRQISEETGIFSNITDEEIEKADKDVTPKGEMAMPPIPGEEGGPFSEKKPNPDEPGKDPKPKEEPKA